MLKNILLDIFFDYSQISLFAFEIASLAIFNKEFIWTNFIKWVFVGFIGFNSEVKLLTFLDSDTTPYDTFLFFITWFLTFILSQFYYLLKFSLKNKPDNLALHMKKCNLKFLISNYLPLYLWNLSELINPSPFQTITFLNFINKFLHLILASFMVFVVPSFVFYIIYQYPCQQNRQKYSFLIRHFHPSNKGFYISLLFFKICLGLFTTFYFYFERGNNYSLIILNFLHLSYQAIYFKFGEGIYIKNSHNQLSILFLGLSLIITIISQIGLNFQNESFKLPLELSEIGILIIMMLIATYINIKNKFTKKRIVRNSSSKIELTSIQY